MTLIYRLAEADFITFEKIAKSCQDGLTCMDAFTFPDGAETYCFSLTQPPKKDSWGVWILTHHYGRLLVSSQVPQRKQEVPKPEEAKPSFPKTNDVHQVIEMNEKEWSKLFPLMTNIDSYDMIHLNYVFPGLVKEDFRCKKYWKTKKGHYIFLNDHTGGVVEFKKLSQTQQPPVPKETTSSSSALDETTEQKKTISIVVDPEQVRLTNEIKGWNFWNHTIDEESEEFIQFLVELLALTPKSNPLVSEEKSHYLNYQNWLKDLRLSRTRESVIRFFNRVPDCVCHEVQEWLNSLVGQAYANMKAKQTQK